MDETNRYDEAEARGVLQTLVDREHFEPIPTAPVLERARRSHRRRRWATGGTAIAAVLAVSVGAPLLADLGKDSRGTDSPAASPATSARTAVEPPFTPVPGVPQGDRALIGSGRVETLTAREATRRCLLRYPGAPFVVDESAPTLHRVGRFTGVHRGDKRLMNCMVPGDSRPSAALVAAAKADPLPTSDAGLLRNCSVQMWHNLTNWRIVARDRDPAGQVMLIAVSPSGRFRATCHLTSGALSRHDGEESDTRPSAPYASESRYGTQTQLRQIALEHLAGQGSQTCGNQPNCVGFMYYETALIPQNVAKVRFRAKDGRTHDVTVGADGMYAFVWTDPSTRDGGLNLTYTAYDANGKVVWPK